MWEIGRGAVDPRMLDRNIRLHGLRFDAITNGRYNLVIWNLLLICDWLSGDQFVRFYPSGSRRVLIDRCDPQPFVGRVCHRDQQLIVLVHLLGSRVHHLQLASELWRRDNKPKLADCLNIFSRRNQIIAILATR